MDLSARASVASHQLVGWIYWDPTGIKNLADRGVPDGLGYYVVTRAAPMAEAGPRAVAAAFYSILPAFIEMADSHLRAHATYDDAWEARNDAVADGLRAYVPEACDSLAAMGPALWEAVDELPISGRVLFAAHQAAPRPDDPVLSAWLAVNCIREWRGDTHWAIVASHGIDGVQAGVLHDAHLNYGGWIPTSRGADEEAVAAAVAGLEARGLAADGRVNGDGLALREQIERQTDEQTVLPWQLLGEELTERFLDVMAEAGPLLVNRIDETAGTDWMPAVRGRRE